MTDYWVVLLASVGLLILATLLERLGGRYGLGWTITLLYVVAALGAAVGLAEIWLF